MQELNFFVSDVPHEPCSSGASRGRTDSSSRLFTFKQNWVIRIAWFYLIDDVLSVDVQHVCVHAGDAYGVDEYHDYSPAHSKVVTAGRAWYAEVVSKVPRCRRQHIVWIHRPAVECSKYGGGYAGQDEIRQQEKYSKVSSNYFWLLLRTSSPYGYRVKDEYRQHQYHQADRHGGLQYQRVHEVELSIALGRAKCKGWKICEAVKRDSKRDQHIRLGWNKVSVLLSMVSMCAIDGNVTSTKLQVLLTWGQHGVEIWRNAILCQAIWYDAMQCVMVRCHMRWCNVMWCDVLWCNVMWGSAMWCNVMWCDAMWCDMR